MSIAWVTSPERRSSRQPSRKRLRHCHHRAPDRVDDQQGDPSPMSTPKIRALGIIQDGLTMRRKAAGDVEVVGWLEAWGTMLIEAMEALQKEAYRITTKDGEREAQS
jgi:hypothetical protein